MSHGLFFLNYSNYIAFVSNTTTIGLKIRIIEKMQKGRKKEVKIINKYKRREKFDPNLRRRSILVTPQLSLNDILVEGLALIICLTSRPRILYNWATVQWALSAGYETNQFYSIGHNLLHMMTWSTTTRKKKQQLHLNDRLVVYVSYFFLVDYTFIIYFVSFCLVIKLRKNKRNEKCSWKRFKIRFEKLIWVLKWITFEKKPSQYHIRDWVFDRWTVIRLTIFNRLDFSVFGSEYWITNPYLKLR